MAWGFSKNKIGGLVGFLLLAGCSKPHAPTTDEAYIWQRVWTPAVVEAIEKSRAQLTGYVVLGGEIVWTQDGPTYARAQVDFAALQREKIGLALRIGPYRGPFLTDDAAAKFIQGKVRELLREANEAGVTPTELQIDFDCAQSKLAGYTIWLGMIQATAGKIPVRITVLPSWLGEPAFHDLAEKAGSFILQVHSVQMLVAEGQTPRIFDGKTAVNWMQQAENLGLPFRVALPTYTNQIITDPNGKIIRITSEDAPSLLPASATSRMARADALEIAAFLQKIHEKPPQHWLGTLWYRLPLTTDKMNWRWQTLEAVIGQKPLHADLKVHSENGDLTLENTGNIDAAFPISITASWTDSRLTAADPLPGWTLERSKNRVVFHRDASLQEDRLPAGGKTAIGWLRLDPVAPIHLEITTQRQP